ncbi:MAG: CHAT domain-containing protein [Myxococcales bacterium]|nr:CHAT domain-containing protein [Myxococcales bacterium]
MRRHTRRRLAVTITLRRESTSYPQPRAAAPVLYPDEDLARAVVDEGGLGPMIARLAPRIASALTDAVAGVDEPLVRLHVVASGSRELVTWVRQHPWPTWLHAWWPTALVTIEGPPAPSRPRLTLPLDLAVDVAAPAAITLDPMVRHVEGQGWRRATGAADVVELDRDQRLPDWHRATRLTIRTGATAPVSPRDRTSTLTLATPERGPEFLREFYRALQHDAPLDAAAATAAARSGLPTSALRLDLMRGGEDDLRLSSAILEQAERTSSATSVKASVDVSDLVTRSRDFLDAGHAQLDAIDFDQELHGVTRTFDLFARRERVRQVLATARYVRHANLWWSDRPRPRLGRATARPALEVATPYPLAFAVLETARADAASAVVDDEVLTELLGPGWATTRAVLVLFAPRDAVELAERRFDFDLARYGDSAIVTTTATPRQPGRLSIRAALFVRDHLIASVVLHTTVGADAGTVRQRCDWNVALQPGFADLPAPARTLIFNEAATGTHWLAAYSRAGGAMPGAAPWPLELDPLAVQAATDLARNRLGFVQGSRTALGQVLGGVGAQGQPLPRPSYAFAGPRDHANEQGRADAIAALAAAGRQLYADLIENALGANGPRTQDEVLAEFQATLAGDDHLLQIARCHVGGATVPWALAYDLPLDAGATTPLCQHFIDDSRADPTIVDRPASCAARATCPAVTAPGSAVCPFGFWGMRLELEEPPYQVAGTQPPALGVVQIASASLPAAVTIAPHEFACLAAHFTALRGVATIAATTPATARAAVLEQLKRGDEPLVYFFCHGDQTALGFALRVGPQQWKEYIYTSDLPVGPAGWTWHRRTPLVFLNGCDTAAFDANNLSQFIQRFRRLGAVGVIGTAIEVFTDVATVVGRELLERLARGERVGAAMLAMRRSLLRDLNPMGLAYAAYAPAHAHVHAPTCALDPEPSP